MSQTKAQLVDGFNINTSVPADSLVIDSSGNVGIGTSSPSYLLDCKSTGTTNVARFLTGSTSSSEVAQFGRSDQAVNLSIDYDGTGSMGIGTTTAHPFNLKTGAVTRATIDTSGRLGIGTTSPGKLLEIGTGGAAENTNYMVRINRGVTGEYADFSADNGFATIDGINGSGGGIRFLGDGNERARIDTSGRLLVGTSSAVYNFKTEIVNSNNCLAIIDTNPGNTGSRVPFTVRTGTFSGSDTTSLYMNMIRGDGTQRGRIRSNGATSVAYESASDYRLKENVVALNNGIGRIKLLKPYQFNFIDDGPERIVDGFFAHEVQEVVPEAAGGEKDAVDDEGNPEYQGIDQSKLVPLLTAALQEAIAKIETLEQRLSDAGIA